MTVDEFKDLVTAYESKGFDNETAYVLAEADHVRIYGKNKYPSHDNFSRANRRPNTIKAMKTYAEDYRAPSYYRKKSHGIKKMMRDEFIALVGVVGYEKAEEAHVAKFGERRYSDEKVFNRAKEKFYWDHSDDKL